jgi:hypothetical protein
MGKGGYRREESFIQAVGKNLCLLRWRTRLELRGAYGWEIEIGDYDGVQESEN